MDSVLRDLEVELRRAHRDLGELNSSVDDYSPRTPDVFRACLDQLEQGGQPGRQLELTQRLCDAVGNPESRVQVVHVAGTNGKGTTCAYICDDLIRAGCSPVGLYTSPHLYTACERIRINFEPISKAEFVALARVVFAACRTADVPIKHSRCLTVMGLLCFVWKGCQVAVLETGLGGEFDSTNVVPRPLCTVITTIHRDHENVLGPFPQHTAQAKAGIIKPNCPCVCGSELAGMDALIQSRAKELNAPLVVLGTPDETGGTEILEKMENLNFSSHTDPLRLLARQASRIAAEGLSIPFPESLPLSMCELQRRRQYFYLDSPPDSETEEMYVDCAPRRVTRLVLDVGHNVDAVEFLRKDLAHSRIDKIVVLINVSRPRPLSIFLPLTKLDCQAMFYMPTTHPRLIKPSSVSTMCKQDPENPVHALLLQTESAWLNSTAAAVCDAAETLATDTGATLVVCGSFFMMAEASKHLNVPMALT